MEVKNVYDGSLYTIDILQYDDRGCTSSGPILRKTYSHHKPIKAEQFSHLLKPFKT